jgi:soluble lytic murein transglycosylase-like protein
MNAPGNITNPAAVQKSGSPLDAKGKARLQKAVKDFEAIFMGMMMNSMRSTVPRDAASGESFGNDVMESLFDAEVAKRMAGRSNLGLAEMLYRSITKESLSAPDPVLPAEDSQRTSLAAPRSHAMHFVPGTPPAPAPEALHPDPAALAPVAAKASAMARSLAPPPTAPAPVAAKTSTMSPSLAPAPVAPSLAPPVPPKAPSPSTLDRIAAYENIIQEAARNHGVDSTMLKAVIAAESGGNRNAVSPKEAKGLMQLTDSTAGEMGVRNVWNPRDNIQGGARYLQSLIQRFPGDTESVIASYNAGPARVEKHGGIPPIPETQAYVRRVMNYINFFEQKEASNEGR